VNREQRAFGSLAGVAAF